MLALHSGGGGILPPLLFTLGHGIPLADDILGGDGSPWGGGSGDDTGGGGGRGSGSLNAGVQSVAAHHVLHLTLRLLDHIVETGGPVVTLGGDDTTAVGYTRGEGGDFAATSGCGGDGGAGGRGDGWAGVGLGFQ